MTSQNSDELVQKVIRISNTRTSIFLYKLLRLGIRTLGFWYFKVKIKNREGLHPKNRLILAPVHRSNLDGPLVNSYCKRRVRSFAKISMFKSPLTARLSAIIGAIPVNREGSDRKALNLAEEILENEEILLLFPEGVRGSGKKIGNLYSGCAYLAIKTQSPVVPVAITGSEAAMPPGKKMPKRASIHIEVGDKMMPPEKNSKTSREAFTQQIQVELQQMQDKAGAKAR